MKKKPTRKATSTRRDRDLRAEYDFTGGVRGKYAARFRQGSNVVVLDPDVAAAFPNTEAVNRALRALLEVVPARTKRAARRRTA